MMLYLCQTFEAQPPEVKIIGDVAIDRGWAKETLKNKQTDEFTENLANYLWISKKDKMVFGNRSMSCGINVLDNSVIFERSRARRENEITYEA